MIDAPVLANGRLELRWYLREQAVSRVLHRYGSMLEIEVGSQRQGGRAPRPPTSEGDDVNIRPNRVKDKLASGQVATILSGTNDPDLIDQLRTLDVDGKGA